MLELITPKAAAKQDDSRSLYAETFLPRLHFNWSELRAVETEKYQFIEAPKPELYDLTADPGETRNIYAEKKAVSGELQARLSALVREYSADHELAEKTHVKLHPHILTGHPVRDVVKLAADIKADLLVIGATGHSALYERLIGSRADRMVQLAQCPVLVVK